MSTLQAIETELCKSQAAKVADVAKAPVGSVKCAKNELCSTPVTGRYCNLMQFLGSTDMFNQFVPF